MFRATRVIRKGSQTIIWDATEVDTKRRVAIKIPAEHASDRTKELLDREIFLLNELRHPHILTLVCHDAIRHMTVTERMDGDLMDLMDLMETLDLSEVERYRIAPNLLLPVAQALEYMHAKNLIHRDLKPENIFFSYITLPPLPIRCEIKLADLGLGARLTRGKTVMKSKELRGTPAYLAPESAVDKLYSKETDIYSFGLLIYVLASLSTPYPELTAEQIIGFVLPALFQKIDLSKLTAEAGEFYRSDWRFSPQLWKILSDYHLSPFWAEMPPVLASLARRCCEVSPQDRGTMTSMIEFLTHAIEEDTARLTLEISKESNEQNIVASSASQFNVSARALVASPLALHRQEASLPFSATLAERDIGAKGNLKF